MFYEQSQIRNNLLCRNCKQSYDEPKLLPCGETICNNCITLLIRKNTEEKPCIKCVFCDDLHPVPENGFTTNKLILKLLNEQPSEVYRGKNAEELKEYLKTIELIANNIIEKLENGVDAIKDHCYNLRSKLLNAHESTIRQLNRFYESMLLQINKYEKETVDQFVNRNENKSRLIKLIDEVSVFHHDWSSYLKRLTIDDDQIAKTKKIAEGIKIKLEVEKNQIEGYIFNERVMKFEKNHMDLQQNLLGSMNFEKLLVQITDNTDIMNSNKTFQKIYLKETMKNVFSINKSMPQINSPFINFNSGACATPQKMIRVNKVQLLDSEKIVASVTNTTDNYTTLLLFSRNGDLLNEAKDERLYNKLDMASNRSLVVYFSSLGHQRKDQGMTMQPQFQNNSIAFNQAQNNFFKSLKILDDMFNVIKKVAINFDVVSMSAVDSKIFCLVESLCGGNIENSMAKISFGKTQSSVSSAGGNGLIKIYNWELGLLKSIGQNINPELPFYIETPVTQLLVTKGRLFLKKDNVITIIDEKQGKMLTKLECNYKILVNGSSSHIIAISRDSDRLVYLSSNGVKFCEKKLIDFPVNLQPIVQGDNTISFFDKDDLILYKVI